MENNLYKPYENIVSIQPAKYRSELDVEKETVTYIRDDENGKFLYDAKSCKFYPEHPAKFNEHYNQEKGCWEFELVEEGEN